jgi:hypothetical protein
MRSLNGLFTVSIGLLTAVAACGGSSTSSISTDGGGDGAQGSSSGAGGEAGASGGDDAAGDDGSTGILGGSSSGATSGGSTDSGTDGPAPVRGDGGPDQIACGTMGPCDSQTQVCCATRVGRSCVTKGTCTGESLACSGSNSCTTAGDVCCEELTMTGLVRTACAATCPANARQLCTTKADCKAGDECRRGLDGYSACVAPANDGGAGGGGKDAAAD